MEQNAVNALKPVGVRADMLMAQLSGLLGEKHTLFLLTIVDGRDVLVVKDDQSWRIPSGKTTWKMKGFFRDVVTDILPRQIITCRQDGVKNVEVLGSAGDVDGYGTALVLCADVDRSCIILNSTQDHTWARSMKGLEQVLSAGQPDDFRNSVVRLGVQQAMKEGLLNWGQGATAH